MSEIIPAILTNDQSDFRHKYSLLFALGHFFRKLHVDFADGEFVRSRSVLPSELTGFLKASPFELCAHLMVENPGFYLKDLKMAGFSTAIFHLEALESLAAEAFISGALQLGLTPGIAINPETPLPKAGRYLKRVGKILLMGVHPGKQGRMFIPETLERIKEIRRLTRHVIIAVDGGIKPSIAKECARAGADEIIVGSAILHASNPRLAFELLTAEVK